MERTSNISAEKRENLRRFLLPAKEALVPIVRHNTFGNCYFTEGTFEQIDHDTKLRIACDIVRQSNRINYFPTPESESRLEGDCTTTAKTFKQYAEDLGISGSFDLASILRRPFDGKWRKSTRHVVCIHSPSPGVHQIIDPSTLVGYGYGTVSEKGTLNGAFFTNENQDTYSGIAPLSQEDIHTIGEINSLRHMIYVEGRMDTEVATETKRLSEISSPDHLASWISEVKYIDALVQFENGNIDEFNKTIAEAVELDPLKIKVLRNPNTPRYVKDKVEKVLLQFQDQTKTQVEIWKVKAQEIFNGSDVQKYPEGIRLIQAISSELYHAGLLENSVPTIRLGGQNVPFWEINPRLLNELGVSVCWIKPCSYRVGVENAANEAIKATGNILFRHRLNPTTKDEKFGFVPLYLTHPYAPAKSNFETYDGPMDIMLMDTQIQSLSKVKKDFRNIWGKNLKAKENTTIPWWNGKQIIWNKFFTNYIHSTDTSAESVVHLLLEYPQFALVNRWDYPHPNL